MKRWFGLLCGFVICCGLMVFSATEVSAAQISPFDMERPPLESTEIAPYAVNTMRYASTTSFGSTDANIRSDVLRIFGLMGYSTINTMYPTASQLKLQLQTDTVTYIHGHGGPGRVYCDYLVGTSSYTCRLYARFDGTLSANYAEMSSYSQNALSQEKLVLYITCESAKTNDGSLTVTGLPQQTVAKGAKCSIGWKVVLVRGGEWGDILAGYLHNRVSIYEAMITTDQYFKEKYYVDKANNPAEIANRLSLGLVSQVIRIN